MKNTSPIDPKLTKPYRFECIQCGNCCSRSDTIVNLTYSDILRMQFDLDYGLKDFLEIIGFYKYDHDPTPEELEKMVIPPIQTNMGLAFPGLRKKSNGKCIFLSKNNNCKIYASRPNICRTFPFHFHSRPIEGPKSGLDIQMNFAEKAIEYCPGIGGNSPEIDPKFWMEIGKDAISSILKEVVLIKKWNQAIEEKKIQPLAENYLRIVLNLIEQDSTPIKQKKSKKKTYQARLREKIQKK